MGNAGSPSVAFTGELADDRKDAVGPSVLAHPRHEILRALLSTTMREASLSSSLNLKSSRLILPHNVGMRISAFRVHCCVFEDYGKTRESQEHARMAYRASEAEGYPQLPPRIEA